MRILFLFLLSVFLQVTAYSQSSERPEGIVLPVATLGDVTETRRQILQNTLIESLSSYYRLVPQDKLEEVQEKIFQEMDYDECTEDQCIVMIQEALQVENLFVLQVIGEGDDTQLSLKWVGLDDKKVKTDVCKGCGTFELNERVEGLVRNLDSVIPRGLNFVAETVDEERLKREREEKLRKQREEQLRKKRDEELRKQREEELRKQREEDGIANQEKNTTFRTLGIVNALDFKFGDSTAFGFLNQTTFGTTPVADSGIKEYVDFNGIYSLYSLNNCYTCSSWGFGGLVGTGNFNFETKDGSLFKYNVNVFSLLFGYQWYIESGFNFLFVVGPTIREYRNNGKEIVNYNADDEEIIEDYVDNDKLSILPAFLFGYSF